MEDCKSDISSTGSESVSSRDESSSRREDGSMSTRSNHRSFDSVEMRRLKFGQRENRLVLCSRLLVLLVLTFATAIVAVATYKFAKRQEYEDFETRCEFECSYLIFYAGEDC